MEGSSKNSRRKSHSRNLLKLNSIKLLRSSRRSMTKDTISSRNGKTLQRLLRRGTRIYLRLERKSEKLWSQSMLTNKYWTRKRDNYKIKRDLISKKRQRMYSASDKSARRRTKTKDYRKRKLRTSKLKSKYWKISFHLSQHSGQINEILLVSRIKNYFKKNKDCKQNRRNLRLMKSNLEMSWNSLKSLKAQKTLLKRPSKIVKTKRKRLNSK